MQNRKLLMASKCLKCGFETDAEIMERDIVVVFKCPKCPDGALLWDRVLAVKE